MKTRLSDKVYQETEQHRHACESRFVASKDAEWIKDHLEGVKKNAGFCLIKNYGMMWRRYGKENKKKSDC